MEPLSILVAAGTLAMVAANRVEKLERRALWGPTTIPDFIASCDVGDSAPAEVVAISIRAASLAPVLAGKRLRARVKYGRCGDSVRCDSDQVVVPSPSRSVGARFVGRKPSAEPVSVDFGTTCLFLMHNNIQPQIRLRLFEAGPLGRAVANADIPLTSLLDSAELQVSLEGVGGYSGHLGTVSIAVQRFCTQKAGLKDYLRAVGACQQKQAFSTTAASGLELGTVVGVGGLNEVRLAAEGWAACPEAVLQGVRL